MTRNFKNDGTTINGLILLSTIDQLKLLGIVGSDILKGFNVSEIKSEAWYPRTIRGQIHEAVKDRFGENALYYLGVEQFNTEGAENFFYQATKNKKFNTRTYRRDYTKRNIQNARVIRNRFLKLLTFIHAGGNLKITTIKAKNDRPRGSFKILEEDTIRYFLTNAVFEGHDDFNRGSLINQIISHIGDDWKVEITLDKKNTEYRRGMTTNAFLCTFEYRKKRENLIEIHQNFRNIAKDNFLYAIIDRSEEQRKLAVNQSNTLSELSKKIGKYIPPQIHKGILEGKYDTNITTKRKKLTIFFSDIKNFTDTSEKLQPEDLTKYLNEYFSEMTNIALEHGATIDKYIGDAVMLFFGDPTSKGEKEDARACVEMSLKMQEKMVDLRKKWKSEGFYNPFEIRIGLNTGYCNVGNFGSSQRLTYTIIGGEVNVAARLEAAGEAGGILMSYETYAHVQDMVEVEEKESVKMKGINREIKVFSVLKRRTSKQRKKIVSSKDKINKASYDHKIKEIKNDLFSLQKKIDLLTKKIGN
mgnify:FL=1